MSESLQTLQFRDTELKVVLTTYASTGNLAVTLLTLDDEPYLTASINFDQKLPKDTFWLKDYSENKGIKKALLRAGFIELTGEKRASGFVVIEQAKWKKPTKSAPPQATVSPEEIEADVGPAEPAEPTPSPAPAPLFAPTKPQSSDD